jgi:hypothetical protein
VVVDPCGVQADVPIWLGGRTRRSLRRALTLADGWDPFGLDLRQLEELLAEARAWPAWERRTTPFELVLPLDERFDPTDAAERDALTRRLEAYRALGATVVNCRFRHDGLGHLLEQLAVVAERVRPRIE